MASSGCFFVVVAVLSIFLLSPASAFVSSKFIDANCERVQNKTFCLETLTTYPPTASATNIMQLAEAVIGLGVSHAKKTAAFVAEMAKKEKTLKKQLNECHDAYVGLAASLKSAVGELKVSPDTANYDVMLCHDNTRIVKDLIEKNGDKASKTLMEMTLQMDKLLDLAAGATDAVDDDSEN